MQGIDETGWTDSGFRGTASAGLRRRWIVEELVRAISTCALSSQTLRSDINFEWWRGDDGNGDTGRGRGQGWLTGPRWACCVEIDPFD